MGRHLLPNYELSGCRDQEGLGLPGWLGPGDRKEGNTGQPSGLEVMLWGSGGGQASIPRGARMELARACEDPRTRGGRAGMGTHWPRQRG